MRPLSAICSSRRECLSCPGQGSALARRRAYFVWSTLPIRMSLATFLPESTAFLSERAREQAGRCDAKWAVLYQIVRLHMTAAKENFNINTQLVHAGERGPTPQG